ncbi:hypothetical protein [Chamaesiphon minutus]|uniref:Uncharacterized protein n=1 Tax=Chamaesiphon minutus (strain ATCC 27169 / PCC 6605) TaxID=1173020 RepID=K9UES6_CHAP6|nr:hypothetical protein [Chamaesiphon minutus]AFY93153.1 hypothetical protein Cha6605_2058 [Chamaesiphon minutus PCC 6605]
MILQLNPTILVETPLGQGQALFLIDYGMHQNTCWVVALNENGIVKHFDCNDIVVSVNYTYHLNTKKHQNHSVGKERNQEQGKVAAPRNAALSSCA